MKLSKLKLHDGISFTQSQLSETVFTSDHYELMALPNGFVQIRHLKNNCLSWTPFSNVQYAIPLEPFYVKGSKNAV